jgi:hypothetical protein
MLNTNVLATFGTYKYTSISLKQAQELFTKDSVEQCQHCGNKLKSHLTVLAIGEQSTAEILFELLGFKIPLDCQKQEVGEAILIFSLKGLPEKAKALSRQEIEKRGYWFVLLTKIEG